MTNGWCTIPKASFLTIQRGEQAMGKNLRVHLVVIDPQDSFMGNDDGTPHSVKFADGTALTATLPVKGAVSDMKRLAKMIERIGPRLEDIHATLDSHRVIDVAHGGMWRDENGKSPNPFTLITSNDIVNRIWTPRNPNLRQRMIDYARALEAGGNYLLIIWPEHCLIGTWGHNVQADLAEAFLRWERSQFANVDYVSKGTNPFTEHYGALLAEVPDPSDPSTQLNTAFLTVMQNADIIAFAGEASSHCVLTTLKQVVQNIGKEHLKKFHLLTDCMSPVAPAPGTPDFPAIAEQFLKDMATEGMTLTTSTEFLR